MARKRVSRWMKSRGFVLRRKIMANRLRIFFRPRNLKNVNLPFICREDDGSWSVLIDNQSSPRMQSAKAAYAYAAVAGWI